MLTIENEGLILLVYPKENGRRENMTIDLRRLKAERIAKGFTQEEMAERMGWSTRTPYAKRENGLVTIGADELAKMASILGYTPDKLIIFFTSDVPERERRV